MFNKLLRAAAITAVLSVLIYNGFIDATAPRTAQQSSPPVAFKLTFP